MSVSGLVPVYNVLKIDMSETDGQTAAGRVISQQIGFLKVAFRDANGAPVLEGARGAGRQRRHRQAEDQAVEGEEELEGAHACVSGRIREGRVRRRDRAATIRRRRGSRPPATGSNRGRRPAAEGPRR